jgi:hypothetical protein
MLSKCANPTCPTTFRYLHEGRLYVMAPREASAGREPRCSTSKSAQIEYAWLCSACSRYWTIQIDQEFGAIVARRLDTKNGSKFSTVANDRTNIDIT